MVDPFVSESVHTWLYDHYRQKDPFFVKGIREESFSYHDYFEKNRKELLNLISVEEFLNIF